MSDMMIGALVGSVLSNVINFVVCQCLRKDFPYGYTRQKGRDVQKDEKKTGEK